MREPSIHITESKLAEILTEILPLHGLTKSLANKKFLKDLVQRASQHQLTKRKLSITNDRTQKKIQMVTSTTKGDALAFSRVLYLYRKSLKHRGITQLKEGTKDWAILKTVASLAMDFANAFELEKSAGFLEYLKIANSKMNKFSLNKIASMNESISQAYQAIQEINQDPNEQYTQRAFWRYQERIQAQTGIATTYNDQPEKYVFFCEVAKLSIQLNTSPEIYIDAQFDAVSYRSGVPDPAQLVGEKSIEKVSKYIYSNPQLGVTSKVPNTTSIDFKALKKLTSDGNRD